MVKSQRGKLVTHALKTPLVEIGRDYHNAELRLDPQVAIEFVYARFAWCILRHSSLVRFEESYPQLCIALEKGDSSSTGQPAEVHDGFDRRGPASSPRRNIRRGRQPADDLQDQTEPSTQATSSGNSPGPSRLSAGLSFVDTTTDEYRSQVEFARVQLPEIPFEDPTDEVFDTMMWYPGRDQVMARKRPILKRLAQGDVIASFLPLGAPELAPPEDILAAGRCDATEEYSLGDADDDTGGSCEMQG